MMEMRRTAEAAAVLTFFCKRFFRKIHDPRKSRLIEHSRSLKISYMSLEVKCTFVIV
jgi:hypothetical protein